MPFAPSFWLHDGLPARLMSPLSVVGRAMTARRVARPGWRAPVPVICCGNATVGGAGKTTVVLDLARRLSGSCPHILLRGHGGTSRGVRRVATNDPASLVGDEALLLAQVGPTWIGADRAASGRAAIEAGARLLLMDDGLQNPSLQKTASILVIDGGVGFGNGRVLPAGPLREPVVAAADRCDAAVLIGPDKNRAIDQLPANLPVIRAELEQDRSINDLVGRKVVAFAGIASPEKFFRPLREAGVLVVSSRPFADHHFFATRELHQLLREAAAQDALLVTTPKDAVRLPPAVRNQVIIVGVGLKWRDPTEIDQLLGKMVAAPPHVVP